MTTADRYTDDWYKAYTVEADISRGLREQNQLLVGALRDLVDAAATVGRVDGGTDEQWQALHRAVDAAARLLEAPMTTADRPYTDAVDIEALAATVHQAYLDTCHRLGWPVKPENQVPYSELSEHARELDRASVRAVLHALTTAGWQPPVRHGDPRMLAAVYGYELGEQESLERLQRLQEIIQQMALQLRAAIALHQPDPDGGTGYHPGGGYGDIDPACSTCGTSDEYAVPWPCQTYESLARAQQLLNDQMPDYDQRVRREAAADALAHAAELIGRHHDTLHGLRISEHVDRWAAEVRAGTRIIPELTGTADDPPTSGE